jgi:DNA polymerase III delta prime subunit
MEEYSDNCFFILTCNDLNKVIEPIRSRCVSVNFERPNKASIVARLEESATTEQVTADYEQLEKLVDEQYPDIRSMVTILQTCKINNKPLDFQLTEQSYYYMLDLIKQGKQKTIYEVVYSGEFDMVGFNRWFFRYVFENIDDFNVCRNVTLRLAEIEKSWNQNANQEIIFLSNILQVVELMKC